MDEILRKVATKEIFPNLKMIVSRDTRRVDSM